ncbi:MAG TPA: hypothetical protein VHI95_11115 [Acidimicrobiales bacterium]|jgi:hypothetical protein|nr:hypothetical protein [Acidimicrobiales bacterium]
MAAARVMDAALELLDRQLIDCDDRLAGNVDDVEIVIPDRWPDGASGELPVVTALLSGPGVLAERFGGSLGRGWSALHRRLHPDGALISIPIGQVRDIGSAIRLGLRSDQLASNRMEVWFRDHVVGKIPGAGHAAE